MSLSRGFLYLSFVLRMRSDDDVMTVWYGGWVGGSSCILHWTFT